MYIIINCYGKLIQSNWFEKFNESTLYNPLSVFPTFIFRTYKNYSVQSITSNVNKIHKSVIFMNLQLKMLDNATEIFKPILIHSGLSWLFVYHHGRFTYSLSVLQC